MLRIRLARVGKRKQPAYRLVITDQRSPRSGNHLEIVGHYNPLTDPATITLKEERLVYWLGVGAKPSDTAAKLLTNAGVMEAAGRAPVVYRGKDVPKKEKAAKEEAPAAAAAPAATAVAEPPAAEEAAAEPEAAAEEPAAEPEAAAEEEAPAAEPEASAEEEAPAAKPEASAEKEPAAE